MKYAWFRLPRRRTQISGELREILLKWRKMLDIAIQLTTIGDIRRETALGGGSEYRAAVDSSHPSYGSPLMRFNFVLFILCASLFVAPPSALAATIAPFTSFGGGDGWLSPGEGGQTFLGTANHERGLAYGNGHVYLVSKSVGNTVRILDQNTGAEVGTLNNTGVSGGTFGVDAAAVGGDGVIYVANLTTQSTTTPYKVYSWATEASVPAVAYSGNAGLPASRVGDSLAGIGSGASTRLAAGYGSAPAVAGNNGYAIIDPTAGTATAVAFTGTPPNAGDFRLGITFSDASHVLGAQGSSLYRYTSFSGATGTLIGSPAIPDPVGATADRLLSYALVAGVPILAVQSIGDSHVSIYNATDPAAPIWMASGNNTSGSLTANGNGTGQLAWGATTDNGNGTVSRILYAMSTNQGIQAFVVTVPEPGTLSSVLLLFGLGALARRRRQY